MLRFVSPPVLATLDKNQLIRESGRVDFRLRPYGSIFVDGTFYAVTPFPRVKLTVGVHTVKWVNKGIGKEIELKAGDNAVKYNLETE